jgi:hypothetical protein
MLPVSTTYIKAIENAHLINIRLNKGKERKSMCGIQIRELGKNGPLDIMHQRWDQVPRRSKHHMSTDYTHCKVGTGAQEE